MIEYSKLVLPAWSYTIVFLMNRMPVLFDDLILC